MIDIFNKVSSGVIDSLEYGLISEDFLANCRDALGKLEEFQQKAMEHPNPLNSIKLFSASDTCFLALQRSIDELEKAKARGENPTTLEKIQDVLLFVGNIGKELEYIFNKNMEVEITQLRNKTFKLQKKAEELGLLDQIDVRINSLPKNLKASYISKVKTF